MKIKTKRKTITLWLVVIALAIILEATANIVAMRLPNKIQPAVQSTDTDNITDSNLVAAEEKANASFTQASLRLENKKQAYEAWAIPYQPELVQNALNARSFGIRGDGVTDDTEKIQSLLNSAPEKSVLFFPAGNYKINGPITIASEFTLCGEQNTVFDCSAATRNIFRINPNGSSTKFINNITITGIEFIGPGIETDPAIIDAYFLRNFKFTNSKMRNVGYATLRLMNCEDSTIDNSVFENVYKSEVGYGILILNNSKNINISNSFFAENGWRGVSIGCFPTHIASEQFPENIIVSNNYFENMKEEAVCTLKSSAGLIKITGNIFYNCAKGVYQRSGLSETTDNVLIDCRMAIVLRGTFLQRDGAPHVIKNNTVMNNLWEAVYVNCPNVHILENVSELGSIALVSSDNSVIRGNILKGLEQPVELSPVDLAVTIENNYVMDEMGIHYLYNEKINKS